MPVYSSLLLMRHQQTSVLTQNCQQQLLVAGLVAPPNGVIPHESL